MSLMDSVTLGNGETETANMEKQLRQQVTDGLIDVCIAPEPTQGIEPSSNESPTLFVKSDLAQVPIKGHEPEHIDRCDEEVEPEKKEASSENNQAIMTASEEEPEDCASELNDRVPRVNNPLPEPVDEAASLDDYIQSAERAVLPEWHWRPTIFNNGQLGNLPTLEQGPTNRIMIFCGKFNPPHRGHLELLCHAFMRTDARTIAVMILPGIHSSSPRPIASNGTSTILSSKRIMELWQDEILGRFAWVWPSERDDHVLFVDKIIELARCDGFDLVFTTLIRSDHQRIESGAGGWGSGGVISSDITRPAGFLSETWASPRPLHGWSKWRHTSQASPFLRISGPKEMVNCPQWPCWVCWKLGKYYPEYFRDDFVEDARCLAGDARGITKRCHEGKGVIWRSYHHWEGRWMWFLSSGRVYPDDPRRTLISSTNIRSLLETASPDDAFEKIKDTVLNPTSLLEFLGLRKGKRNVSEEEASKVSAKKHKYSDDYIQIEEVAVMDGDAFEYGDDEVGNNKDMDNKDMAEKKKTGDPVDGGTY
ncbi:hypothetical protein BKA66DRAFT_588798 [Pyrenochaeta sp. MPI-SDFR-AT-0127]|nr:hypothetical protein BKA66DRAFT_588798 [Pyrenochaeta sp. MPI-SDFR-AT-0127]